MTGILRFIVIIGFCLGGPATACLAGPTDFIGIIETTGSASGADQSALPAITNEFGMVFVYLPPGEFLMGSPPDEPGRQPNEHRHKVVLSRGFHIMTTEVTQAQWTAVMGENPTAFDDCGPDCPVENVSWTDVQRFIRALNRQTGIHKGNAGRKRSGRRYALPTEAQWEYACRAGSRGWFFFGGDLRDLRQYAWYKDNAGGHPHRVARKKPNAFGLYDTHGNVWEWCHDYAGPYPRKTVVDPSGPTRGVFRVARGGSWFYPALEARSANRLFLLPEVGNYNVGFRLVLTTD